MEEWKSRIRKQKREWKSYLAYFKCICRSPGALDPEAVQDIEPGHLNSGTWIQHAECQAQNPGSRITYAPETAKSDPQKHLACTAGLDNHWKLVSRSKSMSNERHSKKHANEHLEKCMVCCTDIYIYIYIYIYTKICVYVLVYIYIYIYIRIWIYIYRERERCIYIRQPLVGYS